MSYRVTTYEDAFGKVLGMKVDDRIWDLLRALEHDGHSEKSIAYSIWKTQEKLRKFKGDPRFLGILRNEIMKYSWPSGDPRWRAYWQKRNEEEKARKISEQLRQQQIAENKQARIEQSKETKRKQGYKGFVYFVQGECGGAIKIGFSQNPDSRLKQLQTGYPDTLKILCLVPGNEKTEKKIQNKFIDTRLNGEWFKPTAELLEEIEKLKAKHGQLN